VEVVASISQGRTAAAQCGLFTHKSVPVIFEPPCIYTSQTSLNRNCIRQTFAHKDTTISKNQPEKEGCIGTK